MSPTTISRRSALKLLGCSTALPVVSGCDGDDADLSITRRPRPTSIWLGPQPVDMAAFPAGVQSGEATPSSVMLWCKPQVGEMLILHYSVWNGFRWLLAEPKSLPLGPDGYTHHVLTDLPADTPVAFQFVTDSGLGSPTGYTTTAIDSAAPVRFGIISCTRQPWAPYPALTALAKMPLDVCLHLGDTSYNDGAQTLEEYRAKWADTLGQTGYVELHQSCSSIVTWDDHEIYNNWNREAVSSVTLDVATTSFFETLPMQPNNDSEIGLWRAYSWGATVDFFVLDCRGERRPSKGEYLSKKQMDWLVEGLCNSEATWKVIVNSVPVSNMPPVFDVDIAIVDRWEGYEKQRTELIDAVVGCGVTGVLFAGGDLHMSAFCTVEKDGPGSKLLELIVGPSGQRGNPLGILIPKDSQFVYTGAQICSAVVELHHDGTGSVIVIDESGETIASAQLNDSGSFEEVWFDSPT